MSRESLEELRERLLRDEHAQELIRMRAFEIYKLRGGQSGGEAQDWFQAQSEVLTFLIEEESRRASDSKTGAATGPVEAASKPSSAEPGKPAKRAAPTPTARKTKEASSAKPASKRASKKAVDPAPKSRGKRKKD